MPAAIGSKSPSPLATIRSRTARITRYSSVSADSGAGTNPARSNSTPLCTSSVASPPSSRIIVGPDSPGQRSTCSVHHQYSSRVSPFQAKTGTPAGASGVPVGPTTTAAAAWSWVEKMLQLAQRTSRAQGDQRLDEDGRLDRHVERPADAGPGQRPGRAVLGAHRHQAGHLVLGEADLGAAERGEREVGDFEVGGGRRHGSRSFRGIRLPGADRCHAHTRARPRRA